jgi:hypothetical protein
MPQVGDGNIEALLSEQRPRRAGLSRCRQLDSLAP